MGSLFTTFFKVYSDYLLYLFHTSYFCCQKISFLSPEYDISWASVLEYYIKVKNIRILCTIPCSMGHVLYSQSPKYTYMLYLIPQTKIELKKSISGIITWIGFIWNWLHSWKYHRLVFLWHTILHTKFQYPPTHKCSTFSLLGFVRTRDTLVTIRGSSRIWRHPWRLTFQHSPRFRH